MKCFFEMGQGTKGHEITVSSRNYFFFLAMPVFSSSFFNVCKGGYAVNSSALIHQHFMHFFNCSIAVYLPHEFYPIQSMNTSVILSDIKMGLTLVFLFTLKVIILHVQNSVMRSVSSDDEKDRCGRHFEH